MRKGAAILSGLILSLLIVAEQDDQHIKINRLIRQLGDKELRERDRATRELIRLGSQIMPHLKESLEKIDNPEIHARLRLIIREIERQEGLKKVYKEAGRISIDAKDISLSKLLRLLEEQSGVNINITKGIDPDMKLTFKINDAPLMNALDIICGMVKNMRYEWDKDANIKMTKGTFVSHPVAYNGPFKLSIQKLLKITSDDYERKQSALLFSIKSLWEGGIKPISYDLRVTDIVDEDGKIIREIAKMSRPTWLPPNLNKNVRIFFKDSQEERYFGISKFSPEIKEIKHIKCQASFIFPARKKEIRFTGKPRSKYKKKEDGILIEVNYRWNQLDIIISGAQDMYLDTKSVVMLNKEGKKLVWNFRQVRREGGIKRYTFWMRNPPRKRKSINELRFNLYEPFEKKVEFCLERIKLP